ncbi:hypothetical protein ABFS82_10G138200 [Erythranthe guttata]
MNRFLEIQDIVSMKKTMLVQEQVFKHQVHELHRLYNLQKKLMQELEKVEVFHARDNEEKNDNSSSNNLRRIDDEESDVQVELTLSIGRQYCTRINNQRSKSTSQLSDESNKVVREIGSSSSTKSNKGDNYGEPIKSAAFQENNIGRPHWLLQDLSLNNTTR